MKHSIKRQMIVLFLGMIIVVFFILFIINANYLEPYYISNKEAKFIKMYEQLNAAIVEDTIDDPEVSGALRIHAERNNILFLVIDDASVDGVSGITNVHDTGLLRKQLIGYLLNQAQKDSQILESTGNYQISQSRDPWAQADYIEMWGTLGNGSYFLIRSPLESIQESVWLSNRFLLYIGCAAIIICMILVWYFSKRLTDPIRELAVLSNRMADLDFEAHYTSGGTNELGELGANFNRMSEKLEHTISELKSANNSLQKDIERKEKSERMRSEFLGNVSHELKTPIALIQGYAEGLKEGVAADRESMEFYCDVIADEADKMNRMVKNLLALNQLEFGDEEIEFERFDLAAVIHAVLQSMEILAKQSGARVIFRQTEPVYVWADEYKVEQVVRNYVSNAFHHLDGQKVVEVKIEVRDDKAKTTVFNTGTPIPQEDVPRIWDKFYKVDKAHTREYGGNGIGLSIVKAILESLHQKYGVNNYDNGVEFWFTLDVK